MKKTFKQIAAQCERIYKLYLCGYGSSKMVERVENAMFSIGEVCLMF